MARTAKSRVAALPLRQVFAKNVRMARVHIGMSQERLANEAGLDRAFVGSLERGQRNISIDNMERRGSPRRFLFDRFRLELPASPAR